LIQKKREQVITLLTFLFPFRRLAFSNSLAVKSKQIFIIFSSARFFITALAQTFFMIISQSFSVHSQFSSRQLIDDHYSPFQSLFPHFDQLLKFSDGRDLLLSVTSSIPA
jgi:hypothetical protein